MDEASSSNSLSSHTDEEPATTSDLWKAVNTTTVPEKAPSDHPPMASLMNPAAILAPPAALPHTQPVACRAPISIALMNGQNQCTSESSRSSGAASLNSLRSNNESGPSTVGSVENGVDSVDSAAGSSITSHMSRVSAIYNDDREHRMRKRLPTDFIFGRIIGEGSFSTVYLAMDTVTRKEYAIKVCVKTHILRERKAREVTRERQLLAILNSHPLQTAPFFVKMYSSFQDTGRLYFELSLAKNGELFTHIQKVGSFGDECTRFYAGEILHALEHMHNLDIVHRDLKPENILLDAHMHILITDFGCATILSDERNNRDGNAAVRRSSFVGTAQYISPELLNDGESTPACDLWAFGAIIYQMVAGLPPFRSSTEWLIFKKIKDLVYEFPEGFNPLAKDLVQKLLVIDPKKRLGACDETRYTSIREHPFFEGLEFESLYKQRPPFICPYLHGSDSDDSEEFRNNYQDDENIEPGLTDRQITRMLGLELGRSPDQPTDRRQRSLLGLASLNEREIERRLIEQRASDPRWHSICEGNLILKRGYVNKRRGLFSRRRMLLLTTGPHLYYVDADTMTLKGEIHWSPELRVESKSFKIFFVHTPDRTYYLQDPEGYALDWTKAINEMRVYTYDRT